MITTSEEYLKYLYRIQTTNLPDKSLIVPSDQTIYRVNLDTRAIYGPSTLSVLHDHNAEILYFKVPRYYDAVDLTTMTGVVQYINEASGEAGGVYPIPYYDITTDPDYIIFPWCISGQATKTAGNVQYNFIFFKVSETATSGIYKFDYKLNTSPATGQVLYGLDISEEVQEEYQINATVLDAINQRLLEYAEATKLTWLDLGATSK